MSDKTNIEWASVTASPWFGCSKVSAGCTNCYAEELTLRKGWAKWGDNAPRVRSKGFWRDAYRYDTKAQAEAHLPGNERPRMFTSLMDWLDLKVPVQWLVDFLNVVRECQHLDWLLLTKRPELFFNRLGQAYAMLPDSSLRFWLIDWINGKAPANVWFGVTVENQAMADLRLPVLVSIPARVRWLSVEPLLEEVDLGLFGTVPKTIRPQYTLFHHLIHWVVVGGESGRNRRDCGVEAIVNVVAQCGEAQVPCFVKQDVALRPGQQGRIPDEVWQLKDTVPAGM